MVFPLSVGNKNIGAFHGSCMYCEKVMAREFGTYSVEVDGKGSLLLPEGKTLDKVYRIHYTKETCRTVYNDIHTPKELIEYINNTHYLSNDSITALITNPENDSRHTEVYKWYAEGFRYPIIEAFVYGKNENNGNNIVAYYFPPNEQEKLYDIENGRKGASCKDVENMSPTTRMMRAICMTTYQTKILFPIQLRMKRIHLLSIQASEIQKHALTPCCQTFLVSF